ncbi:MAG TPA: hypothetical protein VFF06_10565 [Polyangia bacterium]|nr:hypothetical protein [Polyangia bacterium]
MLNWDGVESEGPGWEPEPFELPLVEPVRPPARRDEPTDPEPSARVVVIDLV